MDLLCEVQSEANRRWFSLKTTGYPVSPGTCPFKEISQTNEVNKGFNVSHTHTKKNHLYNLKRKQNQGKKILKDKRNSSAKTQIKRRSTQTSIIRTKVTLNTKEKSHLTTWPKLPVNLGAAQSAKCRNLTSIPDPTLPKAWRTPPLKGQEGWGGTMKRKGSKGTGAHTTMVSFLPTLIPTE